ncbi:ubiquitin carboxyl-terminal hydrolase 38-like isoform X1 [Acipenser oxyrinchus oxyrinchus]|uniref:Ubiquitin carboxyl-terminal hydrolase 38-like isoform X1 n=1 Tax=Acipenser oxyrinchus oxyrinchus TaxID=40147 RepID=A0AAD8GIV7_ACIOX|nr:ubiquitin carboxyl-terminal hydrolase 38-like isoform X1 [Acipenser oxyrinchus oxyrinchus]
MDKILEALIGSSHPLHVKRAIVKKVVEAAEKAVSEVQCQALYQLTTRLILLGEDSFQRQVGYQVLEAYARYHRAEFEQFFSRDFILSLLQNGYGHVDRKDLIIIDYIHSCLRLLISCPSVLEIFSILRVEVLRIVCERPEPQLCARLSTMLSDFMQCIPKDKSGGLFCQQLVRTIGYFHCSTSQEIELREYVSQVTKVSTLLQNIWKAEPPTLLLSLQEVFAIISSTDPSFEPSIALASLVQHIPLQMITVLIRSLTTDQNVKDASMTRALCRMIDWLSWPLAQHVETWVIALLKGLAAVQKFTILIDVTLLKIELVFNRLWYPIVRQGALTVLSHMLLSFQHSPEAFHLVVPHIVHLVQSLKSDGLPNSKAFLVQFTELILCMMYQFSGFPDLYESILEAIKELPKPSEEKIKLILNQSAWTSQSNSLASGLLRLTGKSETGKTGLINLGNTCYMNSIIQTLFMATDFRRSVLSLNLNGSYTLMKRLQLLFAFLAHTQRAAYAPWNFFEASRPPWFTPGTQQDCSEYLRFLLDRLDEEEKTIRAFKLEKTNPSPDSDSSYSDTNGIVQDAPGMDCPSAEPPVEKGDKKTLIEKMFGGKLSTSIRCMECNSISQKLEPFTDLSLAFRPLAKTQQPELSYSPSAPENECSSMSSGSTPWSNKSPILVQAAEPAGGNNGSTASVSSALQKHVATNGNTFEPEKQDGGLPPSVPDLINYFLEPEILDEDNKYYCEKCASLQNAVKTMHVVDDPEYLILTLLRFSYDAKSHVRRKILDNVAIPHYLQLPVHHRTAKSTASSVSGSRSSSPLQVDSPESEENLAKKLKPSGKEEVEVEVEVEVEEEVEEMTMGAQSVTYVLSSVVMHSGMSSESGHYYSYGRNVTSSDSCVPPSLCCRAGEIQDSTCHLNSNGTVSSSPATTSSTCTSVAKQDRDVGQPARDWFLFNDSRVTFTSFQSVQNVTCRFPKDTAYVLFYKKQDPTKGVNGSTINGMRLNAEPPLQKELMDAITKDNKLYLQEQELNARTRALQAASTSCSFRPNGFDDNDPPGSCGPTGGGGGGGGGGAGGGGGGGGFNTISRLVF